MNNHMKKVLTGFEIISNLKKANALNPMTARTLLSAHLKNDPKQYELLNQAIGLIGGMSSPFSFPDSSVQASISLAVSENKLNIGMFPDECHVLIAGQTGMGKTTLLNLIFTQALNLNSHVWLFVRAKDTRCLVNFDRNMLVNSFDGKIKFNPLNPCGLSIYDYCNIFADVFIQSVSLYDGTKNYLIEVLSFLYEKFEAHSKYPSMFDLHSFIKSQKYPRYSRSASYQDSALNRLGGMLAGPLGKVFDCSEGHENSFMNFNCIFEIENLTRQQQIFMVNILLTKLFRYKLSFTTDVWSMCGIDDGNLLFDMALERRPDQGMPIIHDLLSTVRKSKINVFCCTQTPHQIGASIHSNSAIKIMFSLANALDSEYMIRSIGNLSQEQKEFCFGLEKRQILIKNTLRFQTPILGVIPDIPDFEYISDEEVLFNNDLILSCLPEVVKRYDPLSNNFNSSDGTVNTDEESINKTKGHEPITNEPGTASQVNEKPRKINISDQVKSFLWGVNFYQYKHTLTEICKLAGFTAGTGSRIAKQCEKKHFVKMIQIKIGRGNPKYPVLLKEAYETLGIKEQKFYGKGAGFEHVLYQHLIAKHFSDLGYKTTIELHRGNKHIDVAIETNEKLIAIEVAITSVHEIINIEKDLQKAKADFVITACKDEKVAKQVKTKLSKLPENFRGRVLICLVSELLGGKLDGKIEEVRRRMF
jgi:hypothetical protein